MNTTGQKTGFDFPKMTMGEFYRRLASPDFPNPTGGWAIAVTALAGINLLLTWRPSIGCSQGRPGLQERCYTAT